MKDNYTDAVKEARRYIAWRGPGREELAETIGLTEDELEIIKKSRSKLIPGRDPKEIPKEIMDKIVEELTITGDTKNIELCIEKLLAFEREGLSEIALRLYGNPIPAIKLIGEKVLPKIDT